MRWSIRSLLVGSAALAVSLPAVAAPPAAATPPAPLLPATGEGVVAGEYYVVRRGVDAVEAAARGRRAGVDVRAVFPRIGAYRATLDRDQLAALRRDRGVEFVEPVRRMAPLPAVDSGAARRGPAELSWAVDRVDQRDLPLDKAFRPAGTGQGVRAYVLDSGIYREHVEFAGGRIEAGHTVIEDGRGTGDCFGHGTAVSSVLGGATLGVARGVTFVPVRYYDCAGKDTEAGFVAALEWILANAVRPAVVNMSFAGAGEYATAHKAILKMVNEAGLVVVAAAGNFFNDACKWFPGRMKELLTVAGSTPADKHFGFSDSGPCVDLYAPGVQVPTATTSSPTGQAVQAGTSLACPLVVGAAAMYLEKHPQATHAEVHRHIVDTATKDKIETGPTTPKLLLYLGSG